jgi:hypothetical protein
MADLRDFTGKNRKFTGTIGTRISTGTTAQRDDATFGGGTLRFNTSTNLMEYYNGTIWKSIDAPPTITNFTVNGGSPTVSTFLQNTSSIATIVIAGSLFDTTSLTVLFSGTGGGDVSPLTTVIDSSNQITVTVETSQFNNTFEPYDLTVTNASGLFATLENAFISDGAPIFATASGSLGTIRESTRSSYTLSSAAATDADGDTITYSISAGSLPAGLSLNSSTAAITGTATSVVSNTTSTFTVSAATTTQTSTRQFTITVNAPQITTFTSTGPGTFTVPSGVSTLGILMVAGGGSGGSSLGGGGGGGGMLDGNITVTPGSTINLSVGAGGQQCQGTDYWTGFNGGNTTFGPIPGPGLTATAIGGGYGCGHSNPNRGDGSAPQQNSGPNLYTVGGTGGSGGGTGSENGPANFIRGGNTSQSPSAGITGHGHAGGTGGGSNAASAHTGGGGGGAGGAGGASGATGYGNGGTGGIGRISTKSGSPVYYAGGGGGSPHHPQGGSPGPGGLGGGTAGGGPGQRSPTAAANTGGGTGCGGHPGGGGNTAGPGIIIVSI